MYEQFSAVLRACYINQMTSSIPSYVTMSEVKAAEAEGLVHLVDNYWRGRGPRNVGMKLTNHGVRVKKELNL